MVLPTIYIDSVIWEIKKGRQCLNVVKAKTNEIERLGFELLQTTKALELKETETSQLQVLLENAGRQREVDKMQFNLDKDKLKRKIKKRTILVIGETVLIIILLI